MMITDTKINLLYGLYILMGRQSFLTRAHILLKTLPPRIQYLPKIDMYVSYNEINGRNLAWGISDDDEWMREIVKLLPIVRRASIVDVGANIGVCSKFFSRYGFVYAFEPASPARELLIMNMRGRMHKIFPVALGNKNEKATIYIKDQSGLSGIEDTGRGKTIDKETIEITTLDSYHISPDLIKIDVEGYELEVLQGGEKTIEKFRPTIVCEVSDNNYRRLGKSTQRIFDFMRKYGYEWRNFGENYIFTLF